MPNTRYSSLFGQPEKHDRVISEADLEEVYTWMPPEKPMVESYFLRTTGFMTTMALVRRSCFNTVGVFDEELEGSQDLDMWLRIADAYKIDAVPKVLAEHRIHGKQITADLPAKVTASRQIIEKHRKRLKKYPELLKHHLKRTAFLHCAAGLAEAGRAYLLEALELDPKNEELRQHLRLSRKDPDGHATELHNTAFRIVDGIRLFY